MQKHQPQQNESPEVQGRRMREMRGDRETSPAPPGFGPVQQRAVKLEDALRLLSPSLSLAEENGDRRTKRALQNLRETICAKGSLQHPPHPIEEVWRSLPEEDKNRIELGFDSAHWEFLPMNPLVDGLPGRVGLLRGYGNAIVPQVAQVFIEAVMDILVDAQKQWEAQFIEAGYCYTMHSKLGHMRYATHTWEWYQDSNGMNDPDPGIRAEAQRLFEIGVAMANN